MRSQTSNNSEANSRTISRSQMEIPHFEADVDLELQWYRRVKETTSHPAVNLERLYESTPYRFVISKINNVKASKKLAGSQLYAKFDCFLVSKTFGQPISNKATFIREEDMEEQKKNVYGGNNSLVLYYHTNIDRNKSDIWLLIQFSVVQVHRSVENCQLVGYCLVNPLSEARQKVETFKKGSWLTHQESQSMGCDFRYTLTYNVELKNLTRLVPMETIVTTNDEIPCVIGQQLPYVDGQIVMSKSWFIKISNFDIYMPTAFQEEILKNAQGFREALVNNMGERVLAGGKAISIKRRKIKMGFHNGWKLVNEIVRPLQQLEQKQKSHIVLQVLEDDDELEMEVWKNVIGAFVVCLMYELTISSRDFQQDVDVQAAMFIRSFSKKDYSENVDEQMLKGPGRGLQSGLIRIQSSAPTIALSYELIEKRDRTQKELNGSISEIINQKGMSDELLKLQEQRDQLEQEREKLQRQMQLMKEFTRQEMEKELEAERQNYFEKQKRLEAMYRQQIEEANMERFNLQLQIDELNHVVQMKEASMIRQQQQKEEEVRLALQQQQSQLNRMDLRMEKDRREVMISETLYRNLDQKIPAPPKKVQKVRVDPSEYQRYREASCFTMQFGGITSMNNPSVELPHLFYFVIKFFNLPSFRTDNITYFHSDKQIVNCRLVKEAYFIHNQENLDPVYQFTIDPSKYANPVVLHKDLTDYLSSKKLIVDVFNAQNHMYMGQMGLPLHDLLKGKKDRAVSAKEYTMVQDGHHYAMIQIVLTNEGQPCSREISVGEKAKEKTKNKTVSNNPIVIPASDMTKVQEAFVKQKIGTALSGENRREERIRLLKEKRAAQDAVQKVNKFSMVPQGEKESLLQQIESYKKMKKADYIREVYSDFLTEHKAISTYFGKAEIFPYEFANLQQRPQSYRIDIQDPDQHVLEHPELTVIKQPMEWRYFCELNSWAKPKSFDLISQGNIFHLHPGQRLTILFKFISFRSVKLAAGKGEQEAGRTRMLNTLITKQTNSKIVGGFTLKVDSHEQVVDQSYVFFQNASEPVEVVLPVLYHDPEVNKTRPTLISTFQKADAAWINEYEISLQVESLSVMNRLCFNILLYQDEYLYSLKENWRVQINSYEAVSVVGKPNTPIRFRLAIPSGDTTTKVKLYASQKAIIDFEDEYQEGFSLSQGSITVVNCTLTMSENVSRIVLVNCVNESTKELLYGWRVQILPWNARRL